MITYKGSDVKYSWETDQETEGPSLPVCGYVKEGKANSTEEGPEPDYESILKRWKRDLSMERRSALRPHKTRCPLLLVADYRFYREMGGRDFGTFIFSPQDIPPFEK
jgi:disintegrin and metalloproteinase domain-containing protein 17